MKSGEILFCFLCLLLIISSMYHLKLYNNCSSKNADLSQVLIRNNLSNKSLNYKINNINGKIDSLRKVSAFKISNNREMARSSNALGKKASNLIIALQNKINAHQDLDNDIKNEIVSQNIKRQLELQRQQKIRDKTLQAPLPPLSEQPYLLIEPQTNG